MEAVMEKLPDCWQKRVPATLRIVWRPMTLVSLVLHGLLLLTPLPEIPTQTTTPNPLKTVKLTNLLKPTRGKATITIPKLARSPQVRAQSTQPNPRSRLPIRTRPTPAPSEPSSPARVPTPTPAITPPQTPSPPSSGTVANLMTALADGGSEAPTNQPPPRFFKEPEKFFAPAAAADAAPSLKPNIVRTTWIDGKNPVQVYVDLLVTQARASNFQVQQKGIYGGGEIYEVKQGNAVWYFNLLPTRDDKGTIIVVWNRDPSIHAQ